MKRLRIASFVALAGLSACRLQPADAQEPQPEARATAPDFQLRDSKGSEHQLSQALAEKPAVVIFYRGHW